MESKEFIKNNISRHCDMFNKIDNELISNIEHAANLISKTFTLGKSLYICGNGGSAADSQHLAAEFVGKFKKHRKALNAVSLSTDTSIITCIANDYSYNEIFSRQIEAIASKNDCLLCISTSGRSKNVIEANKMAKNIGLNTISLTGEEGGLLSKEVHIAIKIPSDDTAIIQEGHLFIEHMLCSLVEKNLGID